MGIRFQCTSCDADFDLEIPRIIDRPTALKCPKCGSKPQAHRCESFGTGLEDLLSAMSALRSKYRFQIKLDTEELPPPYGPAAGENALGGADDDDLAEGMDDEDEEEEAVEERDEDEDEDEDSDEEESEDEDEDEGGGGDDEEDVDYDDDDDDEEEEEDEE
jgi:DNA-directed RNA polymerase subunit RPC12/RpoP